MSSIIAVTRRVTGKSVHRVSTLFLLMLLFAVSAAAQTTTTTTSATDGRTPSGLQPGSPAGSFELSGFDNVNLYNGNLNFHLPLLKIGGRGSAGYTMMLALNLKSWHVKHTHKVMSNGDEIDSYAPTQTGWVPYGGYGVGELSGRSYGLQTSSNFSCGNYYSKTLARLTFSAADGTEYELRDQLTGGQPQDSTCTQGASRGTVFVTADGTSATFISDTTIYDIPTINLLGPAGFSVSGYLMLRDGTRYRIDNDVVTWARDRNGNKLTFAYDASGRVTTVTDSLNRTVTVNYGVSDVAPYGLCDQIIYSGFGGAQRIIRVSYTDLASALRPGSGYTVKTPGGANGLFPELNGSSGTNYDPTVASAVWLPDDGVSRRSYKLYYNPYAELARVELPTGGAVEYDMTPGSGVFCPGPNCGLITDGDAEIYRRVVERRVYPDGSTGTTFEHKDVYINTESVGTPSSTVTVEQRGQDGMVLARSRHYFDGSALDSMFTGAVSYPYSAWYEGNERQTDLLDTAGDISTATVLRRAVYTRAQRAPVSWWASYASTYGLDASKEPPNDPRLITTVTTVEPSGTNLVSKQTAVDPGDPTGHTVGFDQYNDPTDIWEYDYGVGSPGAFVRRTHTDYMTTSSYVTADANPAVGASLRGLPSRQWVSTDIAGSNKASLTTYSYDQFGLVDCPNITWHDATYTTGFTTRGNATSITRYSNAAAGTGAVTATSHYDIAGNVVSATDPNGNTSTVSFADFFCNDGGVRCNGTYTTNTFAFPTSATSPVPDPGNAGFGSTTALVTSTIYDFYTGLTYSATDANNKTTMLYYADLQGKLDPLDRLKAVVRPDGSRTDFDYGDTVGNLYVHTLSDLDSSRRTESKQFFDGLGRVYRRAAYENYDTTKPWITADIEYDPLGRVKRSSMPYRAAEGAALFSTDKWIETVYDVLGRVKTVTTKPDGAFVTTSYSGNTVTVTDQHETSSTGHSRKSVTDALGRLTDVYEDPTEVNPSGLNYHTAYIYDVLGNLRTVTQGTQTRTFVYDSLSRLTSATNPESGTVGYTYDNNDNLHTKTDARGIVATYGYDALNRNTTVTYTLGGSPAGTPNINRYYDGATLGKGRLWKSESVQNALITMDQYDEMGRPKQQTQKFWVSGTWGQAYITQLVYNKGGGVTSETYPSGHTVSYNYNAAGRLGDNGTQLAFTGNLGDGAQRTYASQLVYDEKGGMNQERFGTDTPVYNKHLYNSRGQLAEIRLSTYAFTDSANSTNWNRGAIINQYSAHGWGATGGGADNNGNLREQDLFIPNIDGPGYDQGGNWSGSVQSFTYDSLNRLSSASESSASPWTQSYMYDLWGNRSINASTTTNAPKPQFTVDTATNRIGVPSGQSGSMTYDAAGNLTNDTYQGGTGGGGTRTYDAENRMTQAQFLSGQLQTATYTYDADGRRVKRNLGVGGEVWQVYGVGGELLAEYASGASPFQPQKEYGYRGGELLVTAEPAASQYYHASTDFSAVQGQRGWYYLDSNGAQMTYVSSSNWWQGAETYNVIWANGGHPGANADSVRQWRAPGAGSIHITGNASDANSACGDGVVVSIKKGTQVLWQQTIANGNSTGFSYDVTTSVAAGDQINFVVNKAGDNVCDSTNFDPAITYTPVQTVSHASADFSSTQGQGGWYYLDSTGAQMTYDSVNSWWKGSETYNVIWSNGGHPGVNADSVRQWRASMAGSVRITGNASDANSACGDGVVVSIKKGTQVLWQQAIANGNSTGFSYDVTTSVAAGDQINFTINKGGDNVCDSTNFDPTITFTGGGGDSGQVNWFVADQLGTPRMVIDHTGTLSGVKRHDYLPFGEEIPVDINQQGWRTAATGYGAGDSIRQKFTRQERDSETQLDYFHSRYLSGVQGRFISGDTYGGVITVPQTLNLYTYVRNNPLKYRDPSGHFAQQSQDPCPSCDDDPENIVRIYTFTEEWKKQHPKEAQEIEDQREREKLMAYLELSGRAFGLQNMWGGRSQVIKQTRGTLQVGLAGNYIFGGVSGNASAGIAFDTNGNLGLYYEYGGGAGVGIGGDVGLTVHASNGLTNSDLEGPFNNASVGAFDGGGASLDGFMGPSSNGPVLGGGFTIGGGEGGGASTTVTVTKVIPIHQFDLDLGLDAGRVFKPNTYSRVNP